MLVTRQIPRQVVIVDEVVEEVEDKLRIEEVLEQWGWGAQSKLARKMGYTHSLVNGLMRGGLVWTPARQARAAAAIGMPAEELFRPV